MRSHNSGNRVNICIFERWNEKTHFSKTKIYFHKETIPILLGHIGLQCMKVGEKTNLGDLPLFVWCMLALALNMFSFEQISSLKKSKKKKNQTKQNKQKNIGHLNGKREKIYQPGIVKGPITMQPYVEELPSLGANLFAYNKGIS